MKRSIMIAAAAALCTLSFAVFATSAEAAKSRTYAAHPDCNIVFPCEGVAPSAFGRRAAASGFGVAIPRYRPGEAAASGWSGADLVRAPRRGVSLAGLVPQLTAKLASIQAACPGTVAVSAVRRTYIAGTRRMSLHASGKAVDVQGPYSCIYAQLRGWAGGYSTDAGRMRHIHISYDPDGGREMGLAFRHSGHRHARTRTGHRYARATRAHYATAPPQ